MRAALLLFNFHNTYTHADDDHTQSETQSTTAKMVTSTSRQQHSHHSGTEMTTKSTRGLIHPSSNIYDSDVDIIKSHSE